MSVVLPGFCSRKDSGQSLQVARSPGMVTIRPVKGAGTDSNDGHKCPCYLQARPNLPTVLPTGQRHLRNCSKPSNSVSLLPSLLSTEYKGSRQAEGLGFQLLPRPSTEHIQTCSRD